MSNLYEYHNSGDDEAYTFGNIIGDDIWLGQTFTPQTVHVIGLVKLKLYRLGSPGTITVSIRATDGSGFPTGSNLTSGTTNGNTLTTDTGGEWRSIILTPYALSASVKYAIVVHPATENWGSDLLYWRDKSIGAYSNGNFVNSIGGSVWAQSDLSADFMFEEWSGYPEGAGAIAIVETRLHYVDAYGQERFILGTPV